MSISVPPSIMDHINELCQAHELFEPNSSKLKDGWEDEITNIIKDSRFVVAGKSLKDLSSVSVWSKTLIGRIFWGAICPFTSSYWTSHLG